MHAIDSNRTRPGWRGVAAAAAFAGIVFGGGFSAGYTVHGATIARPAASTSVPGTRHAATHVVSRPVWDGSGAYPASGVQPLCPATDASHVATAGTGGHAFVVRCEAAGGGQFAWDYVVSASAWHVLHTDHIDHAAHVKVLAERLE